MAEFWLCFLPLFVAVDPIGVLPLYASLTEGVEKKQLRRIVLQSVFTALVVALVFLVVGKRLLRYLGITIADFMIAGGLLLFTLALGDLLSMEKRQRKVEPESLGAVPLGVPLIVGPAVLTTGLLLVDEYGLALTTAATVANVLLAGAVFLSADFINRLLGHTGEKIVSKLASLLLAAIAVMLVRRGVMAFAGGGG